MPRRQGWYLVCVVVILGLSAACGQKGGPTPPSATLAIGQPTRTAQPVASATLRATDAPVPTATAQPLALTVNGQDITLATYHRELARCQAGNSGAGADPAVCPAAVLQQ